MGGTPVWFRDSEDLVFLIGFNESAGSVDVFVGMGGGDEPGLILGRRKIYSVVEHVAEKPAESFGIGGGCALIVGYPAGRKENAEKRSGAVYRCAFAEALLKSRLNFCAFFLKFGIDIPVVPKP